MPRTMRKAVDDFRGRWADLLPDRAMSTEQAALVMFVSLAHCDLDPVLCLDNPGVRKLIRKKSFGYEFVGIGRHLATKYADLRFDPAAYIDPDFWFRMHLPPFWRELFEERHPSHANN